MDLTRHGGQLKNGGGGRLETDETVALQVVIIVVGYRHPIGHYFPVQIGPNK